MHRFYVDHFPVPGGEVTLSPEDAHHARDVLRLQPNDAVELLCEGLRFSARITALSSAEVRLSVLDQLNGSEARLRITLFQGLPKADKMDWIVQKAVELGVERIVPVRMLRSVVRLDDRDAARKTERWQRIAREAGKQSGRCMLPEVSLPVRPEAVVTSVRQWDALIVPWEECPHYGPLHFAQEHPQLQSLAILIGPEGGIAPEEMALFEQAGAIPMTLGPRILRTETAGLAAISAFMSLYGEME